MNSVVSKAAATRRLPPYGSRAGAAVCTRCKTRVEHHPVDTLGISQVESTGFRMLLRRATELAELRSQHGQALRSVEDLAQLLALWKPGVYSKEAEESYFDARVRGA